MAATDGTLNPMAIRLAHVNCRTEIVRILLATRRLDFDSRHCFGQDLLRRAKRRGNVDIAQLLLENAENKVISNV